MKLAGVQCNRDAIGARVYVHTGSRRISGEIQSGASFISQNDMRVHVGLGDDTRYDRIEVQWPGGKREAFAGGNANQIVALKQGTGSTVEEQPSSMP